MSSVAILLFGWAVLLEAASLSSRKTVSTLANIDYYSVAVSSTYTGASRELFWSSSCDASIPGEQIASSHFLID